MPIGAERTQVVGRTGSGKTVAGLFHLSNQNFNSKPWVMVDTKGDELIRKISSIEGVRTIKMNEQPGRAGLYRIQPLPHQDSELENFLWKIWARGRVGIYMDEGYTVRGSHAYDALLTQGRSKNIPLITLSQRPAWLSRFCFSEADYFQIFHLNVKDDRKRVQEMVPPDRFDLENRLPEFHSAWYDVKKDRALTLSPVPPSDVILASFREQLQPKRIAI